MRVAGSMWAPAAILIALAGCAGGSSSASSDAGAFLRSGKPTVLFFVLHDCPISNSYAPEIERISREYAARGVDSLLVYLDRGVDEQTLRAHGKEYGYPCPILMNVDWRLVKKFGPRVTPEAVVIAADGQVQYSGRIDDLYVELGKKRIAPTVRDLRDALDAVVEGRPVANPRVPAIGCSIDYPTDE